MVDASKQELIEALARKYQVDLIMNACDPSFNMPIFDAPFALAATIWIWLCRSPTSRKWSIPSDWSKLGDLQFKVAKDWEQKVCWLSWPGVEPGMADIFARYAQDHLFDEIEEIGIRDGANLEVRGYEFAPNFSIWTTIEECLKSTSYLGKRQGLVYNGAVLRTGNLRIPWGYW